MNERIWKSNKIAYGGDYNPEQWDESTWAEDMRLLKLAHIDTVTLNVFSWASLQPDEDTYDFSKLDRIMEMVRANGLKVILATSTAAHPAWMAKKYPEILRTEANGMKRKFGSRHNSCPNSPVYRKFSARLAEKLAQRYGHYDNIIAWHISNEYGGECYCENCEKAFRVWLRERYQTIDRLNKAWDTAFWSHTFYDWDEIVLPDYRSEHWGNERTTFQSISLDYRRFNSDSILDCYKLEYEAVKKHTPEIPVTTNLMEFYKPLDYQKWAKYMDFISWDHYPAPDYTPAQMALNHELMRGLKNGKPVALMEQTPSVTNWQPFNSLKRPGIMRLWSYQAVAHGSDSILFFQMRRSIGACEKYHGAIIDHAGHENTRVFREAEAMGAELEKLGDRTLGSRISAEVGILFDWDNWWAIEYSAGPSCLLKYRDEVQNYYSKYHAVVLVKVSDTYLRSRLDTSSIIDAVSVGDQGIVYSSKKTWYGNEQPVDIDFDETYFRFSGKVKADDVDYFATVSTIHLYNTSTKMYICTLDSSGIQAISQIMNTWILLLLFAILVPGIILFVFASHFANRVNLLREEMHKARLQDYNIISEFSGNDELKEAFEDLKFMVQDIKAKDAKMYEAELNEKELRNKQQLMEYKMLAHQINPHYLYNTLETIRMKALTSGNKEVANSIKILGKTLHYVLENTGTTFTTLEKELDHVKNYLSIQKMRFGERINYVIEIEPGLEPREYRILPLLLQPVVENAVVHGLEEINGTGLVRIDIVRVKRQLHIIITDNGKGMSEEETEQLRTMLNTPNQQPQSGIALYNISQRMRLRYGEGYGVQLDSALGIGTQVVLVLPADSPENK